ncbi:4a-hydroxytetrahydrobiopterin dehydratase [Halalkalicoccus tibetensis]|uniref:4a-hydroxytetrahydrobiopterin dehydratase n=1 Tax=Halalkalicoccus tibetensis TaxID=175632 RepID=A0ABD5V0S0_9EURY
MAELLDDDEIQTQLPEGWERDGEEITRTFEFDDYLAGLDFAREVGEIADEEFHHPQMIVDFQEVEVRFTSHEEGGITDQDIEMAGAVNDEA